MPITTYYVRAYATNSFGTAYGQEEVFTTLATLPTLTTTVASSITSTTASSGGTISNDGGAIITDRGIVWSTISNPTITTNQGVTSDGTGIGTFTSSIIQLTPGTLYYVRAYATNSGGTAYGNQITFSSLAVIPTISTTTVSTITSSTASSGGVISSSGGATITAKGVCWSTSPNPTVALTTKTNNGTGTATFTSSITGLLPITSYYVRAYATNSIGTAYGQEEIFTTLATLPTLNTTIASAITSSTASSGGTISNDGGASVTDRGIVWSTITNPTITINQGLTSDGNGIGTFTSSISQLTPGALYYVRAYATNSAGTAYGNQITFSVLATIPTITTITISAMSSATASSGGTISSDGGASITVKGVCWSTSPNPTISNNITNNGTGTATFTSILSNLLPITTYYYRAYATNSIGTGYGITYTFTTASNPQITTSIISAVTSSTASSGGTISNDGGAIITSKGVCWSTSPNPTISNNSSNNGTGTATFTSNITGLLPLTTYYVRAYATNSYGTAYGQQEVLSTIAYLPNVTIGNQIWSSTNLDVSTYSDGTVIPQVTDITQWWGRSTGAWCYYDLGGSGSGYGKLYNWAAVAGIYDAASAANPALRKKLAPTGWHVASDAEWTTLTSFLGGETIAGGGNETIRHVSLDHS